MSESEIEPIMENLRQAEAQILKIIRAEAQRDSWKTADEAKVAIWKAMDAVAELAR